MNPVNRPITAKFEVRSFTRSWDNRGYSTKFGPCLDTPALPFLRNFSWACDRIGPVNVSAKFAIRSFSRSWDNSDCSLWRGVANPQFWEGEAIARGSGWYRSRERRLSNALHNNFSSIFSLYAFQRYCRFCAPARHFFPPTSSLPQISRCSPRIRWMAFGLRREKVLD